MPDPEKLAAPQAIAPVTVTMIAGPGTGTGDGGVPMTSGTVGHTSGDQPNVVVQVVTPLMAIGVRFINLFLTTFVGLLTAAGIGVGTTEVHVGFQIIFQTSAWTALVVAGMGSLKDLVTIFSGLEKKFPLASGSV